jgi:lipoyl(octanoyl) transferase
MVSVEILVVRCGIVPYEEALQAQLRLQEARQRDEVADVLLLLEHPPVYTRGRRSTPEELPMGAEWYERQGIEVRETDRGGRVTYHGPGQLVAYPIVSLHPYGDDVHEYVRRLERVMIEALAEHGVAAGPIEGLTGVWAQTAGRRAENGTMRPEIGPSTPAERKIGSIGVHVSRGVTTHGLAVNVDNDLQPFEWIVPCGIEGVAMTSLARELGGVPDREAGGDSVAAGAFADTLVARFSAVYERVPVATDPADLDLGLPPATLAIPR